MTQPDIEVLTLKAIVGDARISPVDGIARIDDAGVTAADFASSQNQALFTALVAQLREGRQPEAVSLLRATAGSVPRELTIKVLTEYEVGFASQRLAVVREAAQRRQTLQVLRGMLELFERPDVAVSTALGELRSAINGLGEAGTLRTLEGSAYELITKLEQIQSGDRDPVVPTGINAVDEVIGGLQPTLTIIGALPAVGKSALLATIVQNMAKRGQKVGVLSLEDEAGWLTSRLTAEASRIPVPVLAFKKLTMGQLERAGAALGELMPALKNIIADDRHGMTTGEVVASARRMVAMGARAILVDHLGEVRLARSERHDLDIADALSQLRGLAKTHGVPVVVLCHLRRREGLDAEKEPKLTDFAFSAAVERMARVALGLWRQGDQLAVTVLKQTNGPAGVTVFLDLHRQSGTVAQTEAPEALKRDLWGDQ